MYVIFPNILPLKVKYLQMLSYVAQMIKLFGYFWGDYLVQNNQHVAVCYICIIIYIWIKANNGICESPWSYLAVNLMDKECFSMA